MFRSSLPLVALLIAVTPLAHGQDFTPANDEEREIVALFTRSGASEDHTRNAVRYWRNTPEPTRARIRAAPEDNRWAIIVCEALGFDGAAGSRNAAARCEDGLIADIQRGKASWSADGQWNGPSAECRARGVRNEYGQLICG